MKRLANRKRLPTEKTGSKQKSFVKKAKAEADGLTQKFQAMSNMTDEARDFEVLRTRLEMEFKQAMEAISANKEIAKRTGRGVCHRLAKAKLKSLVAVGILQDFAKALSLGNAIQGILKRARWSERRGNADEQSRQTS